MSTIDNFLDIIIEVFKVPLEKITDDATPDDIEMWTSVSHMDLTARFEKTFGIQFDVEEITEMDSIGAMKRILQKHGITI